MKINFSKKTLSKFVASAAAVSIVASTVICTVVNANESESYNVDLIIDGEDNFYETTEKSVDLFFKANDIAFEEGAVISAKPQDEVFDNMKIVVSTNDDKVVTRSELINYQTVIEYTDKLEVGKSQVKTPGVDGVKVITTTTRFVEGVAQKPEVKEEVVEEPVNQVVLVGTKKSIIPDTQLEYSKVIEMNASAYAPVVECCGKSDGITADGSKAGKGVVAVDPSVIPLGTKLYVEGYGVCVAHDTGGAIKGNKIDLCYNTYQEAVNFGRKNVSVYILK